MISKAGRAVGIYGCFTETGEVEACPLCMEPLQKKQRLKCAHAFCAACLERFVERLGLQCPVCLKALRVLGDQPEGEMMQGWCRNFAGHTYFHITYNIPRGIQMETHPNPGKPFIGTQSLTILPITPEGEEVLNLLVRAFDQKLVFTVVATDEEEDRVVFNDIPNAEGWFECGQPGFLQKVKAALRAKGIQ
ncbi:hypothetical protein ANANG_G00077080 [Anguilla anguilla]|uniref:E3 ubiquitin-protein ligase n=1 Tax=Anguilla anguilla TaxID=7936 RepID=A0A9D3RZU3_ANGAN|nr:hypothetical protein ANANG_G00077080 [Anguilla anguilla]